MYRKICLVLLIAAAATTSCVAAEKDVDDKDLVNMVNEIDNERSLYLFGGLSVERIDTGRAAVTNPESETFLERAERYMQTHELKFEVPQEEEEKETGRSQGVSESRHRRLRRLMMPLLLALKFKLAVVIPLLLIVVKLISLKALAVGFMALLFSGAALFKDFAAKKERVTTAYITGAPLNAEIVHSDWNRNGQASAQDLAYNYHTLPQGVY